MATFTLKPNIMDWPTLTCLHLGQKFENTNETLLRFPRFFFEAHWDTWWVKGIKTSLIPKKKKSWKTQKISNEAHSLMPS